MKVNSMKKILLVEDDPDIVSSLTVFMKKEGYLIDGTDGQRTALEKIAQRQYDLVLLDISLNDGNGFSTCTAIKSQKDIPIIFLTANDDEFSVVSGLELGADDYICKPFRPRELLARISTVLRRTNGKNEYIACKDITMNISDLSEIRLCGDIKWLAEALSNVIKNCIENTPSGGQINISAEENAMDVKLYVMDNGSGIPKEALPHLFERFYCGKNSGKNGVGIGLSLAKTIITQ